MLQKAGVLLGYIFFVGLMHTIAYYNEFGFKYSELGFEYYHIFFRGMVAISESGLLTTLILLMACSLVFFGSNTSVNLLKIKMKITRLAEVSVFLCFFIAWPVATQNGFHWASNDQSPTDTRLRKIIAIYDSEGDLAPKFEAMKTAAKMTPLDPILLVHATNNKLTIIIPQIDAKLRSSRPAIHTLNIESGERYVTQVQ